jgi:hypothetical protein
MVRLILILLAAVAGLVVIAFAAILLWRVVGGAVLSFFRAALVALFVVLQVAVICAVAFGLLYPLRNSAISLSLWAAVLVAVVLHFAKFGSNGIVDRLRISALMGTYLAVLVAGVLYVARFISIRGEH